MADLLQRVFMVLVRPYYLHNSNKVFYKDMIYGPTIPESSNNQRYSLTTNNPSGTNNSPHPLNEYGTYKADPWFLHSTYTSYEAMKESLKDLIKEYGTENVRCANYIPVDYVVTPYQ